MVTTMEWKLEITKKLEDMAKDGILDSRIAILNMPAANYCEKRSETVYVDGRLRQSCLGCVTQGIGSLGRLSLGRIKEIIDYFVEEYGTRFITINGRGDPFHPALKEETLEKIDYAARRHDVQAYVFTAGDNLDEKTCGLLAASGTNVLISLFGNAFIDAGFFAGKDYPSSSRPIQDRARIAGNLRRLIRVYRDANDKSEDWTTRLGMNYVVSERDLADKTRLVDLKRAANDNRLFFVCNTNFKPHPDADTQRLLEQMAEGYSDFHFRHSTPVNGQCQMGAGSSATIDYDGMLLRCPYMDNSDGDGRFQDLSVDELKTVLERYMLDRSYPCVMRKHQR